MLMTNFLSSRKSVREYKKKLVSPQLLDNIQEYLNLLEKEDGTGNIKFRLYEYGNRIYEGLKGLGGYSGVMIESPHYIGLDIKNKEDRNIIYGAYFMEKLITELHSMGLGTCWISLDDVEREFKKELFGNIAGEIDYLLAIGYAKPKNPFLNEPFSHRIGVDELVFQDKIGESISYEELENRGLDDLFYYIRFSPSILNKQPWRFLIDKDKAILLIKYKDGEEANLIDAGIIMYYFEELGKAIGLSGKWTLIEGEEKVGEDNYKFIAEIKL